MQPVLGGWLGSRAFCYDSIYYAYYALIVAPLYIVLLKVIFVYTVVLYRSVGHPFNVY